jgi:hypothetical protein
MAFGPGGSTTMFGILPKLKTPSTCHKKPNV